MLKISLIDTRTRCLLVVEGKLIAPWAAELRIACRKARADLRGRELMVEMQHVTAISQEGENLLLELMNDGVKFRGSGVFSKHVLRMLSRRTRQDSEEKN